MSTQDKILTTRDAAALLHVSERRIIQFCATGRILARRIGRDWLITPAEVARFGQIPRPTGRPAKVKGS